MVDTFIRMWNVENDHQKYDKIATAWNVGMSEDDENILEGKGNKCRRPNTGRRTALHNSNNKEKEKLPTLVTWSDVTTSTGCCWRATGGEKKQRKAKNGVDDKYHRMNGNSIRRPRETCPRSGAMEDHDMQPSKTRRHLMMIIYNDKPAD